MLNANPPHSYYNPQEKEFGCLKNPGTKPPKNVTGQAGMFLCVHPTKTTILQAQEGTEQGRSKIPLRLQLRGFMFDMLEDLVWQRSDRCESDGVGAGMKGFEVLCFRQNGRICCCKNMLLRRNKTDIYVKEALEHCDETEIGNDERARTAPKLMEDVHSTSKKMFLSYCNSD